MSNFSSNIGKNLKEIRLKRNLSLDNTSKLTGVSKAMLGQIERNESNPTVSTLWKIATGLKVSFSSLIDDLDDNLSIVKQEDIKPIVEDNDRMKLYSIFPFDARKGFEIFTIELEPNCNHSSTPHDVGVEEYIIVTDGEIDIDISGKHFTLKKGSSIRFKGNVEHTYKNLSQSKSIFQNIILYNK